VSPTLALAARSLTKRYGSVCAVQEADIGLAPGEVRGLLGLNGAGKTTLLRMLLGLVRPDRGAIEILGAAPRWGDDALPRELAGLVEEPAFYPYLSGRANLEICATLDRSRSDDCVEEVLARLELTAHADQRVAGYSTGMRQRLGLASALLRSPRVLLLDEPTAGVDPAGMRLVEQTVLDLAQRGVAVLLSSHHIAEVERICDSFTVLRAGRVVWDGTASQMREQAPLAAYELATNDDDLAASLAPEIDGVHSELLASGGLAVRASEHALDAFVAALVRSGVAVRRLEQAVSPLEALFFALTDERSERNATAPVGPAPRDHLQTGAPDGVERVPDR
jgi:ABC-2 type transport system ATP-binding protein